MILKANWNNFQLLFSHIMTCWVFHTSSSQLLKHMTLLQKQLEFIWNRTNVVLPFNVSKEGWWNQNYEARLTINLLLMKLWLDSHLHAQSLSLSPRIIQRLYIRYPLILFVFISKLFFTSNAVWDVMFYPFKVLTIFVWKFR
jgi:hypothetical protein